MPGVMALAMEPPESCVNQAGPNHKSHSILELERELRCFVPEQQHCRQSTRPTTDGSDGSQVEFTYPISARTTRPELVPGKQEEGDRISEHQPKQ